jgi:leucyl-tRNA synthetase
MARAITTGSRPAPIRPSSFDHVAIEAKWQQRWEADRLYEAKVDSSRPKHYALVMFPYTSGDLHLGHWWNFALADVHARYKRMQGFNVLFPPGFDAFGLPAEGAAIKSGTHPHTWTMDNIRRMEQQWRTMGGAYDWSKELATCLPDYYRWNQWLFLQFLKRGLAYRQKAPVNWCPNHGVLANEQVHNGRCWRCEAPVSKRDLEQWFFRITDYAEDLLDFSEIDWPERIVSMQTNWIGRSEGVEFDLPVDGHDDMKISVFTTRVDTVFGMTYVVLAPEHPLVEQLTAPERKAEVEAYVERSRRSSDIERMSTDREKTGVPIGSFAINPANGERLPIWIADYVLGHYGTGAIMAVPASDERDWEFARKFDLPIRVVVRPSDAPDDITPEQLPGNTAYVEPGVMVNSGQFNGLTNDEAWQRIADWFEQRGIGRRRVNYRMRDWLVSRQRYWGTPIPIVYCPRDGIVPVPDDQLPVRLPEDVEFQGVETAAESNPLATSASFVNTTCPMCGGPARRGRARGHAPAVQPLFRARAEGPGSGRIPRTVQAPLQPGRSPRPGRKAHVQEPWQRRQSGRARRAFGRRLRARLAGVPRALGPGWSDQRERARGDSGSAARYLEPGHRARPGAATRPGRSGRATSGPRRDQGRRPGRRGLPLQHHDLEADDPAQRAQTSARSRQRRSRCVERGHEDVRAVGRARISAPDRGAVDVRSGPGL